MNRWQNWGLSLVLVIFLFLLLIPGCGSGGSGSTSPGKNVVFQASPPQPPAALPLQAGAQAAQPPANFQAETASADTHLPRVNLSRDASTLQYSLAAGWNTISFPFDSLTSITGLTYYLYYWDGSEYQMVDPANAGAVDCHKGYWAYTESAANISVTGNHVINIRTITLHQGWNLFAYPQRYSLSFYNLSLTYNGETKSLAEVSSHEDPLPESAWVYGWILYYQADAWNYLRGEIGSNRVTPWLGYWIWSQEEGATLNITINPPGFPPLVDSISPTSGNVGTTVTVNGSNFGAIQGYNAVSFNGADASTASFWSNTRIICDAPEGATTGPVEVTVNDQVSNSDLIFTVPVIVDEISPDSGSVGTTVTITGSNFGADQGNNTVSFSGTNASAVSFWSYSQIVCEVPAGASTGPVVVTVNGTASNNEVSFTVPLYVNSITPASGAPGTTVTIAGSCFGAAQDNSTVSFNGTNASVSSWSNSRIICNVPAWVTTGPVVVTVNSQASNDDVIFTVTLYVNGITPYSGTPGTTVTITGYCFGAEQGSSAVSFNGTNASTATFWSDSQIICEVPEGASTGPVVVTVNEIASNDNIIFMVTASLNVLAVAAGGSQSIILSEDGTVWACGYLIDNVPVQVSGLTNVTAIAAGDSHSLVLKSDGTVWAWGWNLYGQLGDGTTNDSGTPVQVSGLTNVIAISAGYGHSLALKSDGTVWAWGWNEQGQLGDETNTGKNTPVQVSDLTNITAVSAGGTHSLALKDDGTVWAWGEDYDGQLGDGANTAQNSPVQVSSLTNVTAIAGGAFHSLALKSDGTAWAWGFNGNGQLGDETITNRNTPVQVSGLTNVTAIDGGGFHSLARKSDGTVWSWGYNYHGQLGDGTTVSKNTPVEISSLSDVTALSAGGAHSLALTSDGGVWAWGTNWGGQLGDGTYISKNTPEQISSSF